jgi:GlpG protein
MRQLVTLPSAETARTLSDHLLTLKIDSKLEQHPDGWAIWIRDEDQLPRARQELEEFTRNPDDPRYHGATSTAAGIRREKRRADEAYHRRQERFYARMGRAGAAGGCTLALIAISSLVMVLSQGGRSDTTLVQALSIAPFHYAYIIYGVPSDPSAFDRNNVVVEVRCPEGLSPMLHGEVWRLFTPMFIHMNIWHLVFNMWMLYYLGGAIERRRGRVRYVALVLVLAALSNLGQYFFGNISQADFAALPPRCPNFGGMSGVVYGLFGYVWMKARFQPELGLSISVQNITIMVGFFFLCMTPWIRVLIGANVANVAHAVGLVAGMLIGYAPALWESLRAR